MLLGTLEDYLTQLKSDLKRLYIVDDIAIRLSRNS